MLHVSNGVRFHLHSVGLSGSKRKQCTCICRSVIMIAFICHGTTTPSRNSTGTCQELCTALKTCLTREVSSCCGGAGSLSAMAQRYAPKLPTKTPCRQRLMTTTTTTLRRGRRQQHKWRKCQQQQPLPDLVLRSTRFWRFCPGGHSHNQIGPHHRRLLNLTRKSRCISPFSSNQSS